MPLFEYRCEHGHAHEHYYHSHKDSATVKDCATCGAEAVRLMPLPNMLQYFSESNARVIQNLDRSRTITSHGEHQRLCKEKGLDYATQWHTSGMKQTDGLTSKSRPGVKTLF
jgi:hypothetical protein